MSSHFCIVKRIKWLQVPTRAMKSQKPVLPHPKKNCPAIESDLVLLMINY
jgi:hypothetical protein